MATASRRRSAPTASFVAFHTEANNLYPGHVFGSADVVVRDTVAGTTRALTVARSSDELSIFPSLSADGSFVAFGSLAPLLADDTNGAIDVYGRPVAGGDSAAPALSLPGDLSVPATSPEGAVVEYTVTAEDDTDEDPAIACEPPSGSTFPIGDTTVDCTAKDAAGNEARGSFTVHVSGAVEQIDQLQRDGRRASISRSPYDAASTRSSAPPRRRSRRATPRMPATRSLPSSPPSTPSPVSS